MPVTMGGMASGMDTDSIISKLVEVEAQPIKQLQRNKLVNNQKKEALTKLSSTLKDLDGKTRDLYGFRNKDVPFGRNLDSILIAFRHDDQGCSIIRSITIIKR